MGEAAGSAGHDGDRTPSGAGPSAPGHRLRRLRGFVATAPRWALRILLPLAGVAAVLTLFPYHATAGGAHFRVQASLLTRPWFSADTSFGSWIFPDVDGLPLGVHISPVNVDLVPIATAASADPAAYAERLRLDLYQQLPQIVAWLVGSVLVGVLLGLGAAAAVNLAVRQLRGLPRRPDEVVHRLRQLAAAGLVLAVLAVFGAVTYDRDWTRHSRVTGTLAALEPFPGELRAYYHQQAKVFDVLNAVAAIQAGLQRQVEQTALPATAFDVMFISDMHLASTYPLLRQYAASFGVRLLVNTGDEAEFGTRAEMTRTYLDQLRQLTRIAPMVWLAGNHDSPETVAIIRTVPGVTVLGSKSADGSGYRVEAQAMTAFGLTIAGLPDPRVYGGPGRFGSDDHATVDRLEAASVDAAVAGVSPDRRFDIFAVHEPIAADRLVKDLPGQIRQTNAGHLHAQNPVREIQGNGSPVTLVEGSSGAGGLDQLQSGPSPVEFSIESVAADCQFTKVARFQITGATPGTAPATPGGLPRVTASTVFLAPQDVGPGRLCDASGGISRPHAI